MYTKQEKEAALRLYDEIKSVSAVVQRLEYPSRQELYRWIYERKTKERRKEAGRYKNTKDHPLHPTVDLKLEALRRCFEKGESIESVSQEIGYSRQSIYVWRLTYEKKGLLCFMGGKDISRGELMKYKDRSSGEEKPEMGKLQTKVENLELEVAILKETITVLKKDRGVNMSPVNNREKTEIVDALKSKYILSALLTHLHLAKSSYYYQKCSQKKPSKYASLTKELKQAFEDNYCCYGYRRLKVALDRSGTVVSEKVIRTIMAEEKLLVKSKKNPVYRSYKGEITVAPPNMLERDFHATRPNEKWLTDITELVIPSGKVYVSAIVDCFDGFIVSWQAGARPTAALANTTLDKAVSALHGEHPIIHSDRGCHYRWPQWLDLIKKYCLARSMSKKGCSPDNAACEGFWGRLKNECFYGRSFKHFDTQQFIVYLDRYIKWYNEKRIKLSLGGRSPQE